MVIDHRGFDPEHREGRPRRDHHPGTQGRVQPAGPLGELPAGKEPNTETLLALSNALGDLKIAGIRPKPAGLAANLKADPGKIRTTNQGLMSLASKGFYPTSLGLLSNKGEVTISTDEGIVYTLRFGEVVFATGNELSAGTEPTKQAKALGKAAEKARGPKGPPKAATSSSPSASTRP